MSGEVSQAGRPIVHETHARCRVERGARYKVYEPTNVSHLSTHHISDTRAASRFLVSAREEEALRGARADRDAGRRASRLRYGIDHGEALLQRQRAWEVPGQGLGWPPGAPPYKSLPPGLETRDRAELARLLRFAFRLDGRTHVMCVRAAVKTEVEKEQRRELSAIPRR